jgi:molybdate transport system regulatory protein
MTDSDKHPRLEGDLRMNREGSHFLGHGRVRLLESIAEHGSISAAARAIGMSYKAAWDAVDAMNNLAEEPLVVRMTGGKHGGGTRLTEYGYRMLEVYRGIEREYRRFLDHLSDGISDFDDFYGLMRRFSLKTTARNQFRGRVSRLTLGAVNAEVVIDLPGGERLVSIATNESIECLNLSEGDEVHALIKESAVIVSVPEPFEYSARNRLCGKVVACQEGAVNGEVRIVLGGGKVITAIITNESIRSLGLKEGSEACALIKASDVILAVND